jgi:hypothetical protein
VTGRQGTVLGRMVRRSRGTLPAVEPLTPSRYAASGSAFGPGGTAFLDDGADMGSGPASGADRGTGTRLSGAGDRRAGTGHGPADALDARRPGAGGNVAWARPPRDGSDLAWNADPGTSDWAARQLAPAGFPGSGAARPVPGALPRSRLAEPADMAGSGPDGPGLPAAGPPVDSAGLPVNWLRPAGQPGISPAGDWSGLPGEGADGDGREPGLPLAAGSRSARRAAFRPAPEEGGLPGHRPEPMAAAPIAGPPPALTITIGHIEVRAAAESQPQAEQAGPARPPRQQFRPQVSLAEFLGRDEHGPRR